MDKVKILIKGEVKQLEDGWLSVPTTVLIESNGLFVLVDPGSNKNLLLARLKDEGLKLDDINIVFLTHHHLDHSLNIRLFPNSDILLDGDRMNEPDRVFSYTDNVPKTNIKVIKTPGHVMGHESLLVETKKGKIVIAGDLFFWINKEEQKTDYESLVNHKDHNGAIDEILLKENRKKVLEGADYIIPGHGEIFKVNE